MERPRKRTAPMDKLAREARRRPVPQKSKGKTAAWYARLLIWPIIIYCAWGYYQYMTTMSEAINIRNEAMDQHEPGMGIRFIYEDDTQRRAVHGTVERLMVDSLGPLLYSKLMGDEQ